MTHRKIINIFIDRPSLDITGAYDQYIGSNREVGQVGLSYFGSYWKMYDVIARKYQP